MTSVGSPALWIGFTVFVLAMLALDLGVFHRRSHEVHYREALVWSLVWIGLALAFGAGVYVMFGPRLALEYLTGYVIEKSLSVDNIFVILVIMAFFAVPGRYQHKVLFWGILGALVMRALFIFAGAALLARFHWVMYVFGAVLIFTGIRLFSHDESDVHPEKNIAYRFFRRLVPSTPDYREGKFFVREGGRLLATPLFFVVVTVEATDVVFAVDSIPAIFGVTRDPFIVYTSNIFAILGLRALFFLVAGLIGKFSLLNYGLALVLIFLGLKMLGEQFVHVPVTISLLVVVVLIAGSIVASLVRARRLEQSTPAPTPAPTSEREPKRERLS